MSDESASSESDQEAQHNARETQNEVHAQAVSAQAFELLVLEFKAMRGQLTDMERRLCARIASVDSGMPSHLEGLYFALEKKLEKLNDKLDRLL